MRRALSLIVGVPLGILALALAVANRKPITLSLDPFSPDAPGLAVDLPLFAVIFISLILGVIIGGTITWVKQGRFRREAKQARAELRRTTASPPPAASGTLSLPRPRS